EKIDALKRLAKSYCEDKEDYKQKIMIGGTNEEVNYMNSYVRSVRLQRGELSTTEKPLKLISPHDNVEREFLTNDRIVFMKNTKDVKNSNTGTILGFKDNLVQVQLDNGSLKQINVKDYKEISHSYCITCNKSQGLTKQNAYVFLNENMADLSYTLVAM